MASILLRSELMRFASTLARVSESADISEKDKVVLKEVGALMMTTALMTSAVTSAL